MTRVRLAQLDQSGASTSQVASWDGTKWVPATPVAATITRETITAPPGGALIYLGATPLTNSELVFVNGSLLTPGVGYTISGSTITLTSLLTGGETVVVAYSTSGPGGDISILDYRTGFTRPASVTRPVRRYHRIR